MSPSLVLSCAINVASQFCFTKIDATIAEFLVSIFDGLRLLSPYLEAILMAFAYLLLCFALLFSFVHVLPLRSNSKERSDWYTVFGFTYLLIKVTCTVLCLLRVIVYI